MERASSKETVQLRFELPRDLVAHWSSLLSVFQQAKVQHTFLHGTLSESWCHGRHDAKIICRFASGQHTCEAFTTTRYTCTSQQYNPLNIFLNNQTHPAISRAPRVRLYRRRCRSLPLRAREAPPGQPQHRRHLLNVDDAREELLHWRHPYATCKCTTSM